MHSVCAADQNFNWRGIPANHGLTRSLFCERAQTECRPADLVSWQGKKLGTVVARNRAKRLMREVLRHRLPHIAPGWDIIMIARGGAQDTTLEEMDAAIDILLQRAHVLQNI